VTVKDNRWRARRYLWYRKLKSGPCVDCGQKFPPECMEFDHVRGRKLFGIGAGMTSRGQAQLLKEIAKCDLVCANCHNIRSYNRKVGKHRGLENLEIRRPGPKPVRADHYLW
jgi:hypothetical protein